MQAEVEPITVGGGSLITHQAQKNIKTSKKHILYKLLKDVVMAMPKSIQTRVGMTMTRTSIQVGMIA